MISIVLLFFVGLLLSAFFSGSETGFYRTPRVRLVIDGVGGDRIAQGLLWASNNAAAFVATALVGNNVANYLASSAIVLLAGRWFGNWGLTAELALTLLATPFVFIFGELLPKQLFLDAPYRLMRRVTPMLAISAIVLAPISVILWSASGLLSMMSGSRVEPLRMNLRRRELAGVIDEGEAIGLLSSAQRDLALATFALGSRPIRDFMTPMGRQPRVPAMSSAETVVSIAKRWRQDALPIDRPGAAGKSFDCVRASRCLLEGLDKEPQIEAMPEFRDTAPFLEVITQLESNAQPLAIVRGPQGRVIGFVRLERLQQALWEES